MILAVRRSGLEAFLVPVVHGLAEQVGAVLIGLVVAAATMVAIDRSRVEVRIAIIIRVMVVLQKYLLLLQAPHVLFLYPVLRHTPLLL